MIKPNKIAIRNLHVERETIRHWLEIPAGLGNAENTVDITGDRPTVDVRVVDCERPRQLEVAGQCRKGATVHRDGMHCPLCAIRPEDLGPIRPQRRDGIAYVREGFGLTSAFRNSEERLKGIIDPVHFRWTDLQRSGQRARRDGDTTVDLSARIALRRFAAPAAGFGARAAAS